MERLQVCCKCVMDSTDPNITFDSESVCSYCRYYEKNLNRFWQNGEEGSEKLQALVAEVKQYGRGRKYDCIMGLSGGVDSSYLALMAHRLGLRPLVVHVDAGWNSELAVKNIEEIVKRLNFDLHTKVINWEEMRDLQLSFLKAAVPNQDIPQDHAFFAALYKTAIDQDVQYVLTGSNYASESVLPSAWGHTASDSTHIKSIHRKFGTRPLRSFPLMSFYRHQLYYCKFKKMKVIDPLNYIPYDKERAKLELKEVLGWQDYGGKHCESRFTKFFQSYYLPTKFGYDKRKAHLSSLIIAGQMTRDQALVELQKPTYTDNELRADIDFIIKKLEIDEATFHDLMMRPNHKHEDYPTDKRIRNFFYADWKQKIKILMGWSQQ